MPKTLLLRHFALALGAPALAALVACSQSAPAAPRPAAGAAALTQSAATSANIAGAAYLRGIKAGCLSDLCEAPIASIAVMGTLLGPEANDQSACLSFLVGDDEVFTNAHCLAPALRHAGADCSQSVSLSFPPTRAEPDPKPIACARVLDVGVDRETNGDVDEFAREWARLKLARAPRGRNPLPLATTGAPDGLALSAARLEFNRMDLAGSITLFPCAVSQGSFLDPFHVSAFSPVIALPRCQLTRGSSGGPAIDADGRVRAIIKSVTEDDAVPSAVAVNLACLPLDGRALPEACAREAGSSDAETLAGARSRAQREAMRAIGLEDEAAFERQARAALANPQWRNAALVGSRVIFDGPTGVDQIVIRFTAAPACLARRQLPPGRRSIQARLPSRALLIDWDNETMRPTASVQIRERDASLGPDVVAAGRRDAVSVPFCD